MNFSKINYLLIFAYFIIPLLILGFSPISSIGPIELIGELKSKLVIYLIGTAFIYFVVIQLVKFTVAKKIDYTFNEFKKFESSSIKFYFIPVIVFFLIYGTWLFYKIDFSMSRDERFALIENASIGPLFMLMLKLGVLLSSISLIKGKKNLPACFLIIIVSITLLTYSRSLILLVVLPLLPFLKVSSKPFFLFLIFVFFSRFLFTNNLDFTWEWWIVFGFGEMLGVLFGPLAILKLSPQVSFFETINFIFNSIPGVSFITYFLNDNRIPEIAIYINEFTKKNYGLFGVASTPYSDFLLSPLLFCFSLTILLLIFFYILISDINRKWVKVILFSIYLSFGFSITSFYRWSFSGAVYTFTRDILLLIVLLLVLNFTNEQFKGAKGVKND